MSIVIKSFKCKETKKAYKAGTVYAGDRLEELQRLGYVATPADPPADPPKGDSTSQWPKHTGGGYYELSNGEKVKGKDAATAAQTEIDASGS